MTGDADARVDGDMAKCLDAARSVNDFAEQCSVSYCTVAVKNFFSAAGHESDSCRPKRRYSKCPDLYALAVFSRNVLYKSTFYLLSYLLTLPLPL